MKPVVYIIFCLFFSINSFSQHNEDYLLTDTGNLCKADSIISTLSHLGNIASTTKEYFIYDKLNRIVESRRKLSSPYYSDRKSTREYEKDKEILTHYYKNEKDSVWKYANRYILEFFENGTHKSTTHIDWDENINQWINLSRFYYEYGQSKYKNSISEQWNSETNTWIGTTRTIYEYNEVNKELVLTGERWYNINGWTGESKYRKYFNDFDSIYLEIQEVSFNDAWIITSEYRFYYNEDNLLESKYNFNRDGSLLSLKKYLYDSSNNVKEITITDISYHNETADDSSFQKYAYLYNEKGLIIDILSANKKSQNEGWLPDKKTIYNYNTNNLMTEYSYFKWSNLFNDFIPEFKYAYHYNQKNILFRIEKFQNWNIANNDFEYYHEEIRYCNDKLWILNDDVVVYPNPTTGILNINLNGVYDIEATIYDFAGRVLNNNNFLQTREVVIDISSLPNNIYILSLKNDKVLKTYKIIKR